MSATDWRSRCPHGHTQVVRRIEIEPGMNSRGSKAEFYCRTCRQDTARFGSPHYDKAEIDTPTETGTNVDLGYVWSPSHDE